MNRLTVTIVVPCFNEASRLDVPQFLAFARAHEDLRLIFVDDGSDDETPSILEAMEAEVPARIQALVLPRNQGKAEAVRQGVLAAQRTDLIGYWDADLSTPLEAIDDFVFVLARHSELEAVIGSRIQLLGRRIERGVVRHYLGRAFATVVSLGLRLPVYDTQCGAKLFRAAVAREVIFAEPFAGRWTFDVEVISRLLYHCEAQGRDGTQAIYELALREWIHAPGSKLQISDAPAIVAQLGQALWRHRWGG